MAKEQYEYDERLFEIEWREIKSFGGIRYDLYVGEEGKTAKYMCSLSVKNYDDEKKREQAEKASIRRAAEKKQKKK